MNTVFEPCIPGKPQPTCRPDLFQQSAVLPPTDPGWLDRSPHPYRPLYVRDRYWINWAHERWDDARLYSPPPTERLHIRIDDDWPLGSFLTRGDVLVLYEAAYFAGELVVEVGSGAGLSACIMAEAAEGGFGAKVISIDVDAGRHDLARRNAQARGLPAEFRLGDGAVVLSTLLPASVDVAFIDGYHGYPEVQRDVAAAVSVLKPGAWLLAHDWASKTNLDPADQNKSWSAINDWMREHPGRLEFWGVSGITGIFRRTTVD